MPRPERGWGWDIGEQRDQKKQKMNSRSASLEGRDTAVQRTEKMFGKGKKITDLV